MDAFAWACPYCQRDTTINSENARIFTEFYFNNRSIEKAIALVTTLIVCPNSQCKQYSIIVDAYRAENKGTSAFHASDSRIIKSDPLGHWMLRPSSTSVPQPEYIPLALRQDYEEACAIVNLSPKASATLARRCLQGMIHDFWEITRKNLFVEILALKDIIDPQTWEGIDAIRQLGNIGAHMEKDVNIIIDIEPHEAKLLISLIEDLFQTWYVARHDREERSKNMKALAQDKKGSKVQIPTKVN